MAKQETIELDGNELFDAAMSEDPATPQEQPIAEAEGQPRDEHGRFAPKAEPEPQPEPQQQPAQAAEPAKDDEHMLPSWRVREINEDRRAALARAEQVERENAAFRAQMAELQRQIVAQQPKPEPVDIFQDPNEWAEQQLSPFEQRMQQLSTNLVLRASRAENVAVHGRDAVTAAEKALEEAVNSRDPDIPGLQAKLRASDDPVGVMVDWHKSRSLLKETGGDLNAYRAKVLDEAMKDPAFLAKAIEAAKVQAGGATARNVVQLPQSLSRVASAAPASGNPGDSDDSADALWGHALR